MDRPNVKEIYDSFIKSINESKQIRYTGLEEWLHSSSAGLCMRKHIFSQDKTIVLKEGFDSDTLRLFRLGDIVHEDIQKAVQEWANSSGKSIYIEKELYIPEFRVRGFIDLAFVSDGTLYDIKTCNAWKFKSLEKGDVGNYALQIGTYGYWFMKHHDVPLKELGLVYYNKDKSLIKTITLPIEETLGQVEEYWNLVNNFIDNNELPPIQLGTAPMYKWECNPKYCKYYDVCGGGIKGSVI
jgi:hypothetical protein|tara:strand:+ start:16068 stop:16787 length:720 start_codon:yes stop_codon:yes gene_type:complete